MASSRQNPESGSTDRSSASRRSCATIETDLDALDTDIAVYGVPFDEGSPFLAGSRAGPRSIREHSLRFAETDLGLYDPETRRTYLAYELANGAIADVGDVDVPETCSGGAIMATPAIRKFLQGPCFSAAWEPVNAGRRRPVLTGADDRPCPERLDLWQGGDASSRN